METKKFDFSQTGLFMVSVYPRVRDGVFGNIEDQRMFLNGGGQIIYHQFPDSMQLRPGVSLQEFLLMPDSVHGIIAISDCPDIKTCDREKDCIGATVQQCRAIIPGKIGKPATRLIDVMVDHLKDTSTHKIAMSRGQDISTESMWQLGYFQKPVRDQHDLDHSVRFLRRSHTEYVFTQESYDEMAPKCQSCGRLLASNG